MSRWLKSVNTLLENLDHNVGNAVEGQSEIYDDIYNVETIAGQSNVDDILAKRGLKTEYDDEIEEFEEDVEEVEDEEEEDDSDVSILKSKEEETVQASGKVVYQTPDNMSVKPQYSEKHVERLDVTISSTSEFGVQNKQTIPPSQLDDAPKTTDGLSNYTSLGLNTSNTQQSSSGPVDIKNTQLESLIKALDAQKALTKNANQQAISAEKETKKLRRNLVKLNADLESAERELEAQRTELERAAARMEKDHQSYKNEKERLEREFKDNIKMLEEEHKSYINTIKNAHNEHIAELEARILHIEEARAKEGGDIATELSDVIERERETMKKVIILEDERSVFLSQISSLTTQIAALESRVSSLQQIADSSAEQEREADMKLDAALSLHARQISQRQSREAELERTIADLGATLVLAKQREEHLKQKYTESIDDGQTQRALHEFKEKIFKFENEIEILQEKLLMETQKVESLEIELKEVNSERSLEKVQWETQRSEYDLKVSQLSAKLSKSEESRKSGAQLDEKESNLDVTKSFELQKQVSSLTEEILSQRNKLDCSTTEVLTLRNRLNAALQRAELAEAAVQNSLADYDAERGVGTLNPYGSNIRRRQGIRSRKKSNSIRSVLKLDATIGQSRETLGNFVDTVDNLSLELGSIFKNDPLARAVFITYLILIHTWSFFLIMFHVQSVEPSGGIGPDQLMKSK